MVEIGLGQTEHASEKYDTMAGTQTKAALKRCFAKQ